MVLVSELEISNPYRFDRWNRHEGCGEFEKRTETGQKPFRNRSVQSSSSSHQSTHQSRKEHLRLWFNKLEIISDTFLILLPLVVLGGGGEAYREILVVCSFNCRPTSKEPWPREHQRRRPFSRMTIAILTMNKVIF